MKKLILLGVVGILLAASITPAFAHGVPPSLSQAISAGLGLNKGTGNELPKVAPPKVQPSKTPTPDQDNVTPVTNTSPSTSDEDQTDQDDQTGNSQKPQDGKNFVLFGTVVSETATNDGYSLVVDVKSGNHLTTTQDGATQTQTGTVTITLPADVHLIGQCKAHKDKDSGTQGNSNPNKPSNNKGNSGNKGNSEIMGNHGQGKPTGNKHQQTDVSFVTAGSSQTQDQQINCDVTKLTAGQFVWVHGWWTPSTVAGTTTTTDTGQGTWIARQIKILNSLPTGQDTTEQETETETGD